MILTLEVFLIGFSIVATLQGDIRALATVSAMGMVVVAATLVRFVFSYWTVKTNGSELDLVHQVLGWSTIEVMLAFVAFHLPVVRAMINRRRERKQIGDKISEEYCNTSGSRGKNSSLVSDVESNSDGGSE
jgi:hypothetical protein